MDRHQPNAGSSVTPTTIEADTTNNRYPTDQTIATPYWCHMVTESLRNVITAAGLTPARTTLTLLRDAVRVLGLSEGLRLPRMPISGYKLSNATADTNNDIRIQPGSIVSSDGSSVIRLASTIIKQLDAAWAAGNNAGGLLTGSKAADTTYHLFAILNPATDAVDIAFHTALDPSANLPAGFTKWARIASLFTLPTAANWVQFQQWGRHFRLKDPLTYTTTTNTTSEVTFRAGVPAGVKVRARITTMLYAITAGPIDCYIYDPDLPNTVASPDATSIHAGVNSGTCEGGGEFSLTTNTNGQIAYRFSRTGWGTFKVNTLEWEDPLNQ